MWVLRNFIFFHPHLCYCYNTCEFSVVFLAADYHNKMLDWVTDSTTVLYVQSKSKYYSGEIKTSWQHRIAKCWFPNTLKTVISTTEMLILGFFCFALLSCTYRMAGKLFIKLSVKYTINLQLLRCSHSNMRPFWLVDSNTIHCMKNSNYNAHRNIQKSSTCIILKQCIHSVVSTATKVALKGLSLYFLRWVRLSWYCGKMYRCHLVSSVVEI